MESKLAMNEGKGKYSSAYPATSYRGEADLATPGTYDTIILDCTSSNYTSATTGINPVSKFRILIRQKIALNGDDVDTALGVAV